MMGREGVGEREIDGERMCKAEIMTLSFSYVSRPFDIFF